MCFADGACGDRKPRYQLALADSLDASSFAAAGHWLGPDGILYVAVAAVPEVYRISLHYQHRHVPCLCQEVSRSETGNVLEDWLPTQSPIGHGRAREVLDKDCRAVSVCHVPSASFLFRCCHRQPTLPTHSADVGRCRWTLRSFLATTLRYVFCHLAMGGFAAADFGSEPT